MLSSVLVLLICPLLAWAQNVTVLATDSRLNYSPNWTIQGNGAWEFTASQGASVSLTFPGTAIYWHANINFRAGVANVSIDGDSGTLVDPSTGTKVNENVIPAILYSKTGLSSGVNHTISLTLVQPGSQANEYMELYNFTYTSDNVPSSNGSSLTTSAGGSTSTGASSNSGSSTSHKSNVGPIVGGVVGGIGALVLVSLAILLLRRNQAKKNREPLNEPYIAERSDYSGRAKSAYTERTIAPTFTATEPTSASASIPPSSTFPRTTIDDDDSPTSAPSSYPSASASTPRLTPNRGLPSVPSETSEAPPPPYIPRRTDPPV